MPAPDRIVRLKTVLARTGLSRSTIYRKIAEGHIPAPDQDQRQRCWLEGVRHQSLDRRPCGVAAERRVRLRWPMARRIMAR